MTPDEIMAALAEATARRKNAEAEAATANDEERALIADALRAGLNPVNVAEVVDRSVAHVRKLRPDDVPPLRTGGMWAVKNAPKKRARRS